MNCEECGEPLSPERPGVNAQPEAGTPRAWHLECAVYDAPLDQESRDRWQSWKIQKLERDNRVLLARTHILYEQITNMMHQTDTSNLEMEHFYYRYKDAETSQQEEH